LRGVSVIIPVYNGEATIKQAIGSALGQQVDRPIEIVVVNDGSIDSTAAILEGYGLHINVVTQPNRGAAAARNAGVNASSGDYLAFLDADDLWLQGHLAKTCAALDANPDAVLAFTDMVWIEAGERGARVVKAGRAPRMDDLFQGASIAPSTVLMRRSTFEQCGGFREEFRSAGYEDTYMWLLARERGDFEYISEPLAVHRGAPLAEQAWKYSSNLPTFTRLVRRRYGKAADPLIEHRKSYFAPGLLQMALQRMGRGNIPGAMRAMLMLLRLKPSYLLSTGLVARLFRRKVFERLMRAFRGSAQHA
jgi:glycosyltransferase involved in cell wall biosynthesis